MVIVNLVFFLLPLPSPARTIPSLALIIPFPPVNKLPNKLQSWAKYLAQNREIQ